ncbi:hypothetical protein G6F57_005117 [Rhizopus arrhizus]|uniref:Matrin-type domain-containing protein n=1 Tax=Rhizopus oryzae TaxID=64495 RepID=A0A9P7BS62_RHIOR|nr:hypothetical protein G6F24_006699 [Rhizopus arrhizus]KAG0793971.1 hypothetical protein G6F22_005470 [Rhizopus arrhizus]KAG0813044.1 hypothetical protein G6F20_005873 [Rhizopus arrhizus]KAG0831007.1 hypothetical protein G6F18_007887 [Rhizopus arrhizus]KAG0838767.1 hypothetical protein G6F19_002961 [Rhizopus arrhizus]
MDNVLEKQRSAHEDIERLEQAIVDTYMEDAKTHRERLYNEHLVDKFLTRISEKSQYLSNLYQDKDGLRESEMQALSGPNEFSEFYERLKIIKEHHRKFPNEPVEPPEVHFIFSAQKKEEEDFEELERIFSGEESLGRYLDLNSLHVMYLNLKGVKKLDYLQYLNEFDDFANAYPKSIKSTEEYKQYLNQAIDYLYDFFRRARPLYDVTKLETAAKEEFDRLWQSGELEGWKDVIGNADQSLYCAACQKQFTKLSVYDAHLTAKKHIKAQKKLDEEQNVSQPKTVQLNGDKRKVIAWKEHLAKKYATELDNFREETKANVERKQALTDRERALEQEQEQVELIEEDSDDEDSERIYNPLKLPLGWDGKPIPYWLYKLHGLGVEYPCEICGNYVYMGRKAFDKHFQEWRHAHGMRCLGIPNTRQFHEITKIEDAYALYEKQKREGITEETRAETVEEFEDNEGNVYNKKTYEDLKRQGIL